MATSVLIIDDSRAVRRQVSEILQGQGVFDACFEAPSAIEGLKMALSRPPDVIICDLEMPGMDGFKFLGMVKGREELRDIPIILLTGHGNVEAKIRGLEQGASDYVTKPFEPGELVARVRVQLKIKILQDSLKQSNLLLQELSITDPLTHLYNRRYLMENLGRELQRSLRSQAPLSLVMVDIDHFKQVNDTYGHQQGDEMLVALAGCLKTHLREYDIAARFGGEEFTLVLPDTSLPPAIQVAERLRQAVHELTFAAAAELRITISLGVAGFPDSGIQSVNDLIREADAALYRAKRGGRDRVEVMCAPRPVRKKTNSSPGGADPAGQPT